MDDDQVNPSLYYHGEFIFSDETVQSFEHLGNILRRIHARLISEGYSIIDGKLISPSGEIIYERKPYSTIKNSQGT